MKKLIKYSTNKKFKKGVIRKTVKSNKITSVICTELRKGRKYYVRIRSYKKVSGATYYSAWKIYGKAVKIKK